MVLLLERLISFPTLPIGPKTRRPYSYHGVNIPHPEPQRSTPIYPDVTPKFTPAELARTKPQDEHEDSFQGSFIFSTNSLQRNDFQEIYSLVKRIDYCD